MPLAGESGIEILAVCRTLCVKSLPVRRPLGVKALAVRRKLGVEVGLRDQCARGLGHHLHDPLRERLIGPTLA